MSTIGERIKYAIDHMANGEIHAALEHACNAVDVTSQRYFKENRSGSCIFKKIINEYIWLIEFMALGGINLDETLFDNFPITEGVRKPILKPTFADLMYHVVRCGLIHSNELSRGFSFHQEQVVYLANKEITFPEKIVWALLSIAIFCPSNKGEKTADNYWIGFHQNRLVINDFWGNENIAKHLTSQYPTPRVKLAHLAFLP